MKSNSDNTSKKAGHFAELLTCKYITKNKYMKIMTTNYHSRFGEIDIICYNDKYIVFVEVKARKENALCRGVEAINFSKKKKIIKTAQIYLMNNPTNLQPRFDVSEIVIFQDKFKLCGIRYIENAFDLEGINEFF